MVQNELLNGRTLTEVGGRMKEQMKDEVARD